MSTPKIIDNDKGEISAVFNGEVVRGWSYASDDQRVRKMRLAREFVEGWYQALKRTEG